MSLQAPTFPDLAAAEAEAQAGPTEPLAGRLGLTVPHEWWPSAHLLKSFEAAGFAHAQLDAPPLSVLRDPRLCTQHAIALGNALATTALAPILHAPSGLRLGNRPGDRAMDGLIEYAAEIGAAQVIYHALALPDQPESEDRLRFEIRSLGRAVRRAEDLNLTIAVENLAPLYPGVETLSANPMSLRGLAHRLGSEGVGVCLDLGHAHVVADLRHTSLERFIEPVLDVVTLSTLTTTSVPAGETTTRMPSGWIRCASTSTCRRAAERFRGTRSGR